MSRTKAIIPARSQSKGLPNKNILPLSGKPLLTITAEFALRIGADDVIVSSDSESYFAAVNKTTTSSNWARLTLHRRSSFAASDTAEDIDVVEDIVKTDLIQSDDIIIWLRPTVPQRCEYEAQNHLEAFRKSKHRSCRSVALATHHPYWMKTIEGDTLKPLIEGHNEITFPRRQLLPEVYRITSQFEFFYVGDALDCGHIYPPSTMAALCDVKNIIDVDTEEDYRRILSLSEDRNGPIY